MGPNREGKLISNTEEVKEITDFATRYYRYWHPYRTDFGAPCVIVLQALASDAEEVSQSLTEDSTDYNRLYCPITAQTLAVKTQQLYTA